MHYFLNLQLASIDNNRPVNKMQLKDHWIILYSSKYAYSVLEQVKNPSNSLDKSLFTTNKFPHQMVSDVDDGSMDCGDHEAFDYGEPDMLVFHSIIISYYFYSFNILFIFSLY